MSTPTNPQPDAFVDPSTPATKADLKRQVREAKALRKANRSWFGRHKFLTATGSFAALVVALVIATSGGGSTPTTDAAAPVAAEAVADAAGTAPEASAPATQAPVGLTGGDHIVGTDIAAGQYRATVKDSLFDLCTVSQKNADAILDVRTATEGSVIFTVQDVPGSVASFDGCENIVSTTDVPGTAPAQLSNGDWLVGTELAAGQYSATVDTAATIALGMVSQSNGTDVLDITTGQTGNVVFTVKDVPGSVVSFSGVKDITKVA